MTTSLNSKGLNLNSSEWASTAGSFPSSSGYKSPEVFSPDTVTIVLIQRVALVHSHRGWMGS